MTTISVLVVEDGDEYVETLRRFVPGPEYVQVHSGSEALERLSARRFDVVYLDLRFDRIDRSLLLGEPPEGPTDRGYLRLANLQGLYILEALRLGGFGEVPVLLAADFSAEPARRDRILTAHPSLRFVPEGARPAEILRLIGEAASRGADPRPRL